VDSMGIKTRPRSGIELAHGKPIIFPEMKLAKRWCKGTGIELGAAAHNPFHLGSECYNVAPFNECNPDDPDCKDFVFYADAQGAMCGEYAEIDKVGDANNIPFGDRELDYVISSHVTEHIPNLIGAFLEWKRVLKPGGIVFMIFPKRDALPEDAERPVTALEEFIKAYEENHVPYPSMNSTSQKQRGRGHYWIFTLESMLNVIDWCNQSLDLGWEIVETEETDSKVGNGHTIVARSTS
jgi:SAM-dependent methyltransferase